MTNTSHAAQVGPSVFSRYATRELTGHKKKIYSLGWSPNGKRLASGSCDTAIRIWLVEPHCQVAKPERAESELKGHSDYVTALQWKPTNSDVLASTALGDKDKSVRFWDVRSSKCTSVLNMSSGGNVSLAWSPDGNQLAVANNKENIISLIDVRKNKVQKKHRYNTEPFKMMWGPTPGLIMVATNEGTVNVHSAPDMVQLWSLKGHTYSCYTFAVDKERDMMVSGGGDAILSVWDLNSVACVRTVTRMDGPVKDVSISRCGQYVAYASEPLAAMDPGMGSHNHQGKGFVEIVSMATGDAMASFNLKGSVESVAWSPEHPVLALTDEREEIDRNNQRTTTGSILIYAPPKAV